MARKTPGNLVEMSPAEREQIIDESHPPDETMLERAIRQEQEAYDAGEAYDVGEALPTINSCFLHGTHEGDTCPKCAVGAAADAEPDAAPQEEPEDPSTEEPDPEPDGEDPTPERAAELRQAIDEARQGDTTPVGEALLDALDRKADADEQQGNAYTGQLFEAPRPQLVRDDHDPDVLILNFSGSVELNRGNPDHVAYFNRLRPGQEHDLDLTVRVLTEGTKARLDKDKEYVKDRVLAKGLKVTDVGLLGVDTPEPDGEEE